MSESLQLMAQERDAAQREALAEAERARLARVVHDGVLQVLALVQRRGAEIGRDAAELGRLAGEQEAALRTLIRSQDSVRRDVGGDGASTWPPSWRRWSRGPGSPSPRPGSRSSCRPAPSRRSSWRSSAACLDNVTSHVGDGARAWVLLEALPDQIEVDVRDEGPGIPDGRLEEAEARGSAGCQRVDPRADRAISAAPRRSPPASTGRSGSSWSPGAP